MYEVTQTKEFVIDDREVTLVVEKNKKTTKVTIVDGEKVLATRFLCRGWRPRHWNLTACRGGWDAKLSYCVGRGHNSYRTGEYLDFN
jgi:hypothetical protein